MDLLERIAKFARDDPSRVAFVDCRTHEKLTYAELHSQILAAPSSGHVDPLQVDRDFEFPIRFLGSLARSKISFPLHRSTRPEERLALLKRIHSAAQPLEGSGMLMVTTGTTGRMKIVFRSTRALDAVARNVAQCVGFRASDRIVAVVPLAHSYGIEHGLLAPLWAGATTLLCQGLDIGGLSIALNSGGTILPAVPAILESLSDTDRITPNGLRLVYSAGAALPTSVQERFERRQGVPIGQLYGATEIGSVLYRCGGRPGEPSNVGLPMDGVKVRLSGRDRTAAANADEVMVETPSMFSRYVDDDADLSDGFWPTGDLGHFSPSGELVLTGRLKLLIDIGGHKVNPIEVEEVLLGHPAVAACVVVPVRQSETVCRLRALVIATDPARPPGADELRAFARDRLAAYKVPRAFEFRIDLPRSPAGKVLRHLVQNE